MGRYRTIPAEVEAIQWLRGQNDREVFAFVGQEFPRSAKYIASFVLKSPAGTAVVEPGSWILRRKDGGFGQCADSIFHTLYEPIEEE